MPASICVPGSPCLLISPSKCTCTEQHNQARKQPGGILTRIAGIGHRKIFSDNFGHMNLPYISIGIARRRHVTP